MQTPDPAFAAKLAQVYVGGPAVGATRFLTGSQHFVFEVTFADHDPVVVRVSRTEDSRLAIGASRLSRQLRPLGVPLPRILAEDLLGPHPYQILERLPGSDLGQVIGSLTTRQGRQIGQEVARAQRIVAQTPSAGRYGYAVDPGEAPFERWSDVLRASLDRSRRRIARTQLFDAASIERAAEALAKLQDKADAQPAMPFLHDTTTKNVIVRDDGQFSGIVDVDDLCFGDPRYVIALTLAALTAFGGSIDYAHDWLVASGLPDDELFRLYVALALLDFMSEQGQVFNGNERPSTGVERARLLGLFERAMANVAG